MKEILLAFTLLTTIFLTSCATPYQRAGTIFGNIPNPGGYGYSEKNLPNGNIMVTFSADPYTSLETTYRYAMKRAAVVTINRGYNYFTVVRQTNYRASGYAMMNGLPTSIVEIHFSKQKTPDAYDARLISQIQG